jgi:hypothetical protein
MDNLTLHKVNFTPEAVFDYEFCLIPDIAQFDESDTDWNKPCIHETPLVHFHKIKSEIKNELEEFIQRHSSIGNRHYFRVTHWDEQSKTWLMLFVKRGHRFASMRTWDVVGIIDAEYFCEDAEDWGIYREWYDFKFDKHRQDIVMVLRLEPLMRNVEFGIKEALEIEYYLRDTRRWAHRHAKKRVKELTQKLKSLVKIREQLESYKRILAERLRIAKGEDEFVGGLHRAIKTPAQGNNPTHLHAENLISELRPLASFVKEWWGKKNPLGS